MLIVIKQKNNVYIAVTALRMQDAIAEADMLHKDNLPVWHPENVPTCLMASAGIPALGYDLLRYGDFQLHSALNQTNLITKIIPAMKARLAEFDQLNKRGENWSDVIVAKGSKAFNISCNFTYEEIEESMAFGRCGDVARGTLLLTRGQDPIRRIRAVCETLERTYKYKQFPVAVMNTKEEACTVLYDV